MRRRGGGDTADGERLREPKGRGWRWGCGGVGHDSDGGGVLKFQVNKAKETYF